MKNLMELYRRLHSRFGPQGWWPGETPFEIAVGAILTQNTNWGNVESAIANLKAARALSARRMHAMPVDELAGLITPSGYFNVKARRLKAFVGYLTMRWGGSLSRMSRAPQDLVRRELLAINGIGPETADSIMLYALDMPVFVIDAYTKRILSRHEVMRHSDPYELYQELFHMSIVPDMPLYNEYHALLVRLGKTYCRPAKPLCEGCPLQGF